MTPTHPQIPMDTGENSSGDEYDTPELLNDDDDDFLGMMDVPTTKKPQTLSKGDRGRSKYLSFLFN